MTIAVLYTSICKVIKYSKGKHQMGKVANPARGQLAAVRANLVSLDGFGSPVPRQPAHLYTQAKSAAYLQDYALALRDGVHLLAVHIMYLVLNECSSTYIFTYHIP